MRFPLLFFHLFILLTLATQAGEMKFLWSVPTPDKNVFMLRFINNDEEFVAGSNVDLAVHNSETGELLRSIPELDASKFELMKGGQTALVLSGARLVKVDLNEMNIIQEETLKTDENGWSISYRALVLDSIRNKIYLDARLNFNDGGNETFYHKIMVYSAETLKEEFELTTGEQRKYLFATFDISVDCKYFASVTQGQSRLLVWETETNKLVVDYPLMPESSNEWGNPADLEFSPSDSDLLYVSGAFRHNSNDEDHQGFKLFDISKNKIINSSFDVGNTQLGWSNVALFNNENYILNGSGDRIRIWNIIDIKLLHEQEFYDLDQMVYRWGNPIIGRKDNLILGSNISGISAAYYFFDSSIVEDLEETVLYPNPTTNQVFLPCEYFIPRENIKVFDEGGREVTSLAQINTNEEGITLILDELAKGMYILQIVYAGTAISYKIIKGE